MKVWNYIVIMTTMIIFLNFVGLAPTATNSFSNQTSISFNATSATNPISVDFQNSSWFQSILVALIAGSVGAVAIGLFTKQFEWKLVVLTPMLAILGLFITTGWSILQLAVSTGEGWLIMVIATIFVPMMVGFGISVVEWFAGGND
jgi:hypothetical protein